MRVTLRGNGEEHVVDVPIGRLPPSLRIPNCRFVAVFDGRDLVRVETAGPAWLEIQEKIRTVLNHDWDPIAVAGDVQDEYDNYIEEIYSLLQKGSSHEAIAEYLQSVETDQMEVLASPQEKLLTVAARLRELQLPNAGETRR